MKPIVNILLMFALLIGVLPVIGKANNPNATKKLASITKSEQVMDFAVEAWVIARAQFQERAGVMKWVDQLKMPCVTFTKGQLYLYGIPCYGLTNQYNEIYVRLTGNVDEDIDTLIHEFTHHLVNLVMAKGIYNFPKAMQAHRWVDTTLHWRQYRLAKEF
jgi:hypothetical protein